MAIGLVACIVLLIGSAALIWGPDVTNWMTAKPPEPAVRIGAATFTVELATTDAVRTPGLGMRTEIAADRGMLFVYPAARSPADLGFWMRRCLMDIDIAFISADRRVVTIHTMKAPRQGTAAFDEPADRYHPTAASQFALEVRAGELARRGIKPGDAVEFSPEIVRAIGSAEP